MNNGRDSFKGKKIVVMGLGLLGGALNDTIFLAEHGAELLITDLKSEEQLKYSLDKLKKYKNIKYVLGEHRLEDFKNADMILEPGNAPLDSIYLSEAEKNNIPVYVSESLFAEKADGVFLIGITGTRGKSTTTQLIYEILNSAKFQGKNVFLGGNVKNVSTLSLLEKVKTGDVVVMELDSWALGGMGLIKRSPNIAVFTNLMDDHLNYYKGDKELYFEDKANIYKYQKKEDVLVCGKDVSEKIGKTKSKKIVTNVEDVPKDWKPNLVGKHNFENIACAIAVAKEFGIEEEKIKKVVENFKGVSGRMEFVKEVEGVKIYNDTTATTPDATIAGLKALSKEKNVILIAGGADKGLDMGKLILAIPKYCKDVVLLEGTGTVKLGLKNYLVYKNLSEAVAQAFKRAKKGDTILFSPAFASFGMFKNEFDRGEKFMDIIKKMK